jgi:hypothetical protein
MHQEKISSFRSNVVLNRRATLHFRYSFAYLLGALFFCAAFSPCIAAGPATPAAPAGINPPAVMVERSASDNATTYSIAQQGCRIEWIARNAEVGVIKLWSECSLPLLKQMPLIEMIYAEFLRTDSNARSLRMLFLGEINPDATTGARDMSTRLALAAHKSSGWDARRGDAKNGDENGFVKDIANREMIYPELKELFGRFHQNIQVAFVEKVLVQRADQLPFYDLLKAQGVQAAEKLPFDCMTWFTITAQ